MTPNPREAPQPVAVRMSIASIVSLLFMFPLLWRLVGLLFERPFGGHIWAAAGTAFVTWLMLLVPGGLLALVGICLRPTRFGFAVLTSWMVAPIVLTIGILVHG